jgi:hypothetical protein
MQRKRTDPHRLTARQEAAVRELVVQPTVRKAAEAARVSEANLRRWLSGHAAFQRRYRAACRELIEGSARYLHAATGSAASKLWQVAQNEKHSAAARVSAARAIIQLSMRATDMLDVLPRLEGVEAELCAAEQQLALPNEAGQ